MRAVKLGIDFGTTRIVVAAADRGNYPLVSFDNGGDSFEWFPDLVALGEGSAPRFGWDAWNAQSERGWIIVRSLKRFLEDAGPETSIEAGGVSLKLADLLHGMAAHLYSALRAHFDRAESIDVMLGVPANANSNQRFLTVEAFRRAGFSVLGVLNEPSAASIEFGHRHKICGRIRVYDRGGGTFDVSLVELGTGAHAVLESEGISTLGGDDFDHILAELAVGGQTLDALADADLFFLMDECRRQKEALHPNSRKVVLDLDAVREGLGQVTISVADYYDRCRPLIEETMNPTARLAAGADVQAL